jgi:hypothetical protein
MTPGGSKAVQDAMPKLASIKVSSALLDTAKAEAALFQRSAGGQLEHWARVGRAIEASPDFDYARVRAALNGQLDAAALTAEERAVFLDGLGEALAQPLPAEEQFWAERRKRGGGVGLDDQGRLVQGLPGGARKVLRKKARADA